MSQKLVPTSIFRVFSIALSVTILFSLLCHPNVNAAHAATAVSKKKISKHLIKAQVELGRLLFFDKILSGNRDISCATCHHPFVGTGDGLSLPVGTGGVGLSVSRVAAPGAVVRERVPRNAPALFNLANSNFTRMFHDGRVELRPEEPSGFRNPLGDALPRGLDSAVAVQAMFPVQSAAEMAGSGRENEIAHAVTHGNIAGPNGVWELLSRRLAAIPEYVEMFSAAFSDIHASEDITFVHAANSIAAFEMSAFRSLDSPFDQYRYGDKSGMSVAAERGMKLFYGRAGCGGCHSGGLQTDHNFHSIGIPPVGPGKGDGPTGNDDFGRERVTGKPTDRYRFRTPSLRNVALTGPWGHNGAYNSLEAIVRHHVAPEHSIIRYDDSQLVLPELPDENFVENIRRDGQTQRALINSLDIRYTKINAREMSLLLHFLHALTGTDSLDLRKTIPANVPSGLPVAD